MEPFFIFNINLINNFSRKKIKNVQFFLRTEEKLKIKKFYIARVIFFLNKRNVFFLYNRISKSVYFLFHFIFFLFWCLYSICVLSSHVLPIPLTECSLYSLNNPFTSRINFDWLHVLQFTNYAVVTTTCSHYTDV